MNNDGKLGKRLLAGDLQFIAGRLQGPNTERGGTGSSFAVAPFTFYDGPAQSFRTRPGSSLWETDIDVLVNGRPPAVGASGPGITVHGTSKEEAALLRSVILGALHAAGLAR